MPAGLRPTLESLQTANPSKRIKMDGYPNKDCMAETLLMLYNFSFAMLVATTQVAEEQ
jgi:hypothetical protein